MIETDTEFDKGTSPCINTDPRLPRQHTLDAHQLRVLHRAIDALAYTAEQYRAPDSDPADKCDECGGRMDSAAGCSDPLCPVVVAENSRPPAIPAIEDDGLEEIDDAIHDLMDAAYSDDDLGNDEGIDKHEAIQRRGGRLRDYIMELQRQIDSSSSGLPRGVTELIDATVSAWGPIMAELIEQQARFQRGE